MAAYRDRGMLNRPSAPVHNRGLRDVSADGSVTSLPVSLDVESVRSGCIDEVQDTLSMELTNLILIQETP